MTEQQGERLQKVLARAGVASRRAAETLITAGRVTVNGRKVTELGTRVGPHDQVRVDERLVMAEEPAYYLLHKPAGMITSLHDPEGRPAVGDLLVELTERVFPVGRLDWDAEGLVVLTNDGELANRLTHPRYAVPRTYHAKVRGVPGDEALQQLMTGVRLEDGLARVTAVERGARTQSNNWISLTVAEGRPHLIKRLCEAVGHPVQRLRRVAYGGLTLEGLPVGEIRPLTQAEVRKLRQRGGGSSGRTDEVFGLGLKGRRGARKPAAGPARRAADAGEAPSRRASGEAADRGRGPAGRGERPAPTGRPAPKGRGAEKSGRAPAERGGRPAPKGRAGEGSRTAPKGRASAGSRSAPKGGGRKGGRGPAGGGGRHGVSSGGKTRGGGNPSRGGRNGGQSRRS